MLHKYVIISAKLVLVTNIFWDTVVLVSEWQHGNYVKYDLRKILFFFLLWLVILNKFPVNNKSTKTYCNTFLLTDERRTWKLLSYWSTGVWSVSIWFEGGWHCERLNYECNRLVVSYFLVSDRFASDLLATYFGVTWLFATYFMNDLLV